MNGEAVVQISEDHKKYLYIQNIMSRPKDSAYHSYTSSLSYSPSNSDSDNYLSNGQKFYHPETYKASTKFRNQRLKSTRKTEKISHKVGSSKKVSFHPLSQGLTGSYDDIIVEETRSREKKVTRSVIVTEEKFERSPFTCDIRDIDEQIQKLENHK